MGAPVFHFKPTPSSGLMRQHFLIMKFTLRTILLSTICLTWSHMLLAQTFSKNDFTYTVTSANEVTITSGPNPDGTVTIPATVTNDGTTYNVTEIGDISFFNRNKIKTVFIPSSVSRIGNSAFWGCNALTSLVIYNNQIKSNAMGTLVNSLRTIPAGSTGEFLVDGGSGEGNEITNAQVIAARTKHWLPKKYENNSWKDIPVKGDVNGDGKVNVSDVTTLVNMILGTIPKNEAVADINGDGKVNVSDVTALVNLILGQ